MKFTWKSELPALALVVLSLAIAAWVWPHMADRLPVHWGLDGRPDRWGGRAEALLMPVAILAFIYLLFRVLPALDPGRANYERFAGAFFTIRLAVMALILAVQALTIAFARGQTPAVNTWVMAGVGVLLIVLGNVMGKLRPNWFIGIRTPWTLSSKRAWSKTHRLGGWLFVTCGALWIMSGLLDPVRAVWLGGITLGACSLGLAVYSYFVWRTDPDRVPPAGTLPSNGPSEASGSHGHS
jgi:uncharacterized membrane protein